MNDSSSPEAKKLPDFSDPNSSPVLSVSDFEIILSESCGMVACKTYQNAHKALSMYGDPNVLLRLDNATRLSPDKLQDIRDGVKLAFRVAEDGTLTRLDPEDVQAIQEGVVEESIKTLAEFARRTSWNVGLNRKLCQDGPVELYEKTGELACLACGKDYEMATRIAGGGYPELDGADPDVSVRVDIKIVKD